ncbi:MAG: 2,5-diketo-D-gluconic acid reductase [Actinobacteria bacterium]|nr:2,5-diketo-D-gluconic acid reductase [Actinomycetota bacterium]
MEENINYIVPRVGLGTYNMNSEEAEEMSYAAINYGYRHIDTAAVYRNEDGVGKALKRIFDNTDLKRSDITITTKLWPGGLVKVDRVKNKVGTIKSLDKSLRNLNLDFVDLYLVHSPHAKNKRLDQWETLLSQQEQHKVKNIGVSNWGINHIEELNDKGYPLPAANQIELHPWSQKPELVTYLKEKGIDIIAYSSLVPLSTWRHKDGENSLKTDEMYKDGEDSESPFKKLATKYEVTEAQVLLKWALQLGYAILPKSIQIERMKNNYDLNFIIDEDDMLIIKELDRGGSVTWEYGDPLAIK